ncbi:Gfo/Idh/MocA family oxidoreductase [bacterium]|nr:Gfo/Idh/MocA family oxidoreductase [bacterium]
MSTVKIGVIGYGGMGGYHVKHMAKSGIIEAKGIYDIDPKSQKRALENGLYVYKTYEEMLSDPELEAVLIATPNDWHPFYAKACAKAGKGVICEKPAAINPSLFEDMAETADECGTLLMVHQNRRWDEDYLIVKNIYEKNLLGPIGRIESRVQGANGVPGGWRCEKIKGGGMMLDWGVHMIDQVMFMMKEKLLHLYCQYSYEAGYDCDDAFKLEMVFSGNKCIEVVVDTNCFTPLPRWVVYGHDGTAVVEDWDLNGKMVRPIYTEKPREITGIKAGNGFTKTMAYRPHDTVETLPLEIVKPEPFAFYKHFIKAMHKEEDPYVKNWEVLRVLKIMTAAAKSAAENKVVEIDF